MKNKVVIGIILIVVLAAGYLFLTKASKPQNPTSTPTTQSDKAQIVKTVPEPLDQAIVPANQVIEITFNKPLQNIGEFKLRFETKKDIKVELSSDRKTAKITPLTPFDLGTEYAIYIQGDTKFDGVGAWGEEKSFHFRTIKYRGI